MIEAEDFKNIIKNSIQYKAKNDNNTPYLVIEDTNMVCPYCSKKLIMEKHVIECDCEKAQLAKEAYNKLYLEQESFITRLNDLNKDLQANAVNIFKNYYENEVMPRLFKEFNQKNADILAIETLD